MNTDEDRISAQPHECLENGYTDACQTDFGVVSVDQSVFLQAGDQAGIERLIQYMTRCPFSSSRLVKVSGTGQVIYQAEK